MVDVFLFGNNPVRYDFIKDFSVVAQKLGSLVSYKNGSKIEDGVRSGIYAYGINPRQKIMTSLEK